MLAFTNHIRCTVVVVMIKKVRGVANIMCCLRLQQPTSREMHSQRSRVPGKFAEHSRSREVEDSKTGEWAMDQDRPSITYYHKSSCTQTQRSNLTSVIFTKSTRPYAQALCTSYSDIGESPGSSFRASRVVDVSSKRRAPDIEAGRAGSETKADVGRDTPMAISKMRGGARRYFARLLNHHAHQLLYSHRERSIASSALDKRQDVSCAREKTDAAK